MGQIQENKPKAVHLNISPEEWKVWSLLCIDLNQYYHTRITYLVKQDLNKFKCKNCGSKEHLIELDYPGSQEYICEECKK